MSDPVLERIWRTKREIAREFNYDLKKYARYMREQSEAYARERDLRKRQEAEAAAESALQTAPRPPRTKHTSRSTGQGRAKANGRSGAAPSKRETSAGNPAR